MSKGQGKFQGIEASKSKWAGRPNRQTKPMLGCFKREGYFGGAGGARRR